MSGNASDAMYSAAHVRELDRRASVLGGIPSYDLMQRAAAAAWVQLRQRWPQARSVHIVAGPGNNGGDGYELARLARAAGLPVRVSAIGESTQGDAARARAAWLAEGGAAPAWREGDFDDAEIVVDALLGIGVTRPLQDRFLEVVQAMRRARAAGSGVLAIDVPSGLDADTGAVQGAAVIADLTVTFIGNKLGLHTGAGPDHVGTVVLDTLGVPEAMYAGIEPLARRLPASLLAQALPRRARTAHKGLHGHVLVIGGDEGMAGAALLAARAALRTGSGWVSVATHPAHAAAWVAAQAELMVRGVRTADELSPMLEAASVVVLGPGLGQRPWGRTLWAAAMSAKRPLILDADALNWLAQNPMRRDDAVLTPHPGEAARLLECTTAEIQRDRVSAARRLRERYGGTVVLKGAGTLVQGECLAICTDGNPGMGVGGMGDVLSGVIAALRAQGLSGESAAQVGVLAHARAADRAAVAGGERGLLPSDLLEPLRQLVNP